MYPNQLDRVLFCSIDYLIFNRDSCARSFVSSFLFSFGLCLSFHSKSAQNEENQKKKKKRNTTRNNSEEMKRLKWKRKLGIRSALGETATNKMQTIRCWMRIIHVYRVYHSLFLTIRFGLFTICACIIFFFSFRCR